jgi:MFS family permease
MRGAPVLITTWSLGGLYLALVPSLIIHTFKVENGIVNGLSIATLSGVGAIAPSILKRFESSKAAMIGMSSIIIGILILLISLHTKSLSLFFISTALSGIGFGGAFSAIIQQLAPIVGKHERAELFAAIFIVSYLALSVPAMLAGELVKPLGLLLTVQGYVVLILVTAIVGLLLQRQSLKK